MLHNQPIAPHIARHGDIGKKRRPYGDPVSDLKQMTRFEPIPHAAPANLSVPLKIFDPAADARATAAGKLVFHAAGDTGGVHGTATQEAIATAMEDQITGANEPDKAGFFYNLGDVIYFNGQSTLYKTEFYEPYQYYPALIFAIPGNHDGDTQTRKGDLPDAEPSLYGFFLNFCDSTPEYVSPYRMSMTQPYVYWTLDAPFVTIIGLYSNVEGSLDARGRNDQQHYLDTHMKNADPNKKMIVSVHHPPFSLDAAHGGTPDILTAIDRSISFSGRLPDLVLSGHVHNYQRFSRQLKNRQIPYVVAGAAGYADTERSMHKLQKGIDKEKLPYQTTQQGVKLQKFQQEQPGFLRITASKAQIDVEYWIVPFDGTTAPSVFDHFTA